MNKPKVELKSVKTFEGHDGIGLSADVWINGVKCMVVFDDARGSEMDYTYCGYGTLNEKQILANIKLLKDYIKEQLKNKFSYEDKEFESNFTMDVYINDLFAKQETIKYEKKMAKLMATAILFGILNDKTFSYVNYKTPLSKIPSFNLQKEVNGVKAKYCKDGVVILNTNLKELGVVIYLKELGVVI
jgi:hypothetical protein